ncbi:MAG: peroxiredoxin [Propionibacteriales bacterium]|nr:peroxiredoxin [Propionibacteriales bacterium]
MALTVGDRAPDFTLQSQYGEPVTLSDFAGKQNVIVVFYPFAFSRVCTFELSEIRDNLPDLADDTTAVLAISCDHMFSLRAFAEQVQLEFSLLSDFWPHGAVSTAYGAFNAQLGCPVRATFIVDRVGVVRWQVETDSLQARSLDDYRKILAELG